MRIFEITRPKDQKQADQVLRDAGYRRLASGSFGAVYQKKGEAYVLKVFSALDKAYRAFVKLAKANQDNPHFPKIFGKVVKVTPDYHAVRMEPLEPYKGDPQTLATYMRYRDEVDGLGPESITRMSFEDALENFYDQPALKQACDLIVDHLSGFTLDIKQDNIMVRGKTLVFVDPVSTAGVDTSKLPDTKKWDTNVRGDGPPQSDRKVQWTPSMEKIFQELGESETRPTWHENDPLASTPNPLDWWDKHYVEMLKRYHKVKKAARITHEEAAMLIAAQPHLMDAIADYKSENFHIASQIGDELVSIMRRIVPIEKVFYRGVETETYDDRHIMPFQSWSANVTTARMFGRYVFQTVGKVRGFELGNVYYWHNSLYGGGNGLGDSQAEWFLLNPRKTIFR